MPRWVKNFPYEFDKAALLQLARISRNLNNAREMNFYIYDIKSQEDAEAMEERAEGRGWHTRTSVGENSLLVLVATKPEYVLSESVYREDVAFFQRLAMDYNAHYDGWDASGE